MNKPEALRLAEVLETLHVAGPLNAMRLEAAATELRRLHAENEAMRNVANRGGHIAVAMSRIADLESQRDALLEAMQSIADCCDEEHAARDYASRQAEIRGIARAAIKAVEETK